MQRSIISCYVHSMAIPNPFALGQALFEQWVAIGETVAASSAVIAKRGALIDAALRRPLDADVTELARMAPEKILAFSRSGASLANDFGRMQGLFAGQWGELLAIASRGGWARMEDYERLATRGYAIMALAIASGSRALQPVHATATANHRRLRR